jgi:hypothetical protein
MRRQAVTHRIQPGEPSSLAVAFGGGYCLSEQMLDSHQRYGQEEAQPYIVEKRQRRRCPRAVQAPCARPLRILRRAPGSHRALAHPCPLQRVACDAISGVSSTVGFRYRLFVGTISLGGKVSFWAEVRAKFDFKHRFHCIIRPAGDVKVPENILSQNLNGVHQGPT